MNTLPTVARSTGTESPLASGVLSRTSAFYVPDSITVSFQPVQALMVRFSDMGQLVDEHMNLAE